MLVIYIVSALIVAICGFWALWDNKTFSNKDRMVIAIVAATPIVNTFAIALVMTAFLY